MALLLAAPRICAAEENSGGSGEGKIPLLISDHHGDHAAFLLRRFGFSEQRRALVLVVDAHADTVIHEEQNRIRRLAGMSRFNAADSLFQNHNWLHPLFPFPMGSLMWVSKISSPPDSAKLRGFLSSTAAWNSGTAPGRIPRAVLNIDELARFDLPSHEEHGLFVSIDLDFFYSEDYGPADIPFVLDVLFDFSAQWKGRVFWAFCLSRAWLPAAIPAGDAYAWELLRQSLRWLSSKTEFEVPELTLFTGLRQDTSKKAAAYREMGLEVPGFFGKEGEMPPDIRELLDSLF